MQEHKEFVKDFVSYLKKSAELDNVKSERTQPARGMEAGMQDHLQEQQ
jgi:hypothetical protein